MRGLDRINEEGVNARYCSHELLFETLGHPAFKSRLQVIARAEERESLAAPQERRPSAAMWQIPPTLGNLLGNGLENVTFTGRGFENVTFTGRQL